MLAQSTMLGFIVIAWALLLTVAFSRLVNRNRDTEGSTRSLGLVDQMLRSGRSYVVVGEPGTLVVIGHGVELGGVWTLRAVTFELRRDDGAILRVTRGAAIQLIALHTISDGEVISLAAGTELRTRYQPPDGSEADGVVPAHHSLTLFDPNFAFRGNLSRARVLSKARIALLLAGVGWLLVRTGRAPDTLWGVATVMLLVVVVIDQAVIEGTLFELACTRWRARDPSPRPR